MSTSPGSGDFEELQRLLALKRCEQPPRRYFNEFPRQVLDNLGAPERPETLSWLERLGVHCDLSPTVVGALGLLVVVLLGVGIVVSNQMRPLAPSPPPVPPSGAPVPLDQTVNSGPPLPAAPRPQGVPSTAPVLTPEPPPPFTPLKIERTGFTPVGEPK
jgi:hypothetical protein